MATKRLVVYSDLETADDSASPNTVVMRDANGAIDVNGITTDTLAISQGLTGHSVAKTGTYTALVTDFIILCDASGGAFTVNLPPVASATGMLLWVKKTETSANAITLDGSGSETIDGSTTYTVAGSARSGVLIYCDGTAWYALTKF